MDFPIPSFDVLAISVVAFYVVVFLMKRFFGVRVTKNSEDVGPMIPPGLRHHL
jgi:hypothetical protein